jgi:CheY-like chemotaxis protein
VENHDDTRSYLAVFLRRQLNATVVEASNARECLGEIKTRRPTLVLSDILMPGCDGFEMIREIRALEKNGEPRIPIITMTALGSEADRKRIFDAGFHAYLLKPFTPDQLIETIKSVLDGKIAAICYRKTLSSRPFSEFFCRSSHRRRKLLRRQLNSEKYR